MIEMHVRIKGKAITLSTAALATALLLLLLTMWAASAATITVNDSGGDVSGDSVVDVWDCTYLARAIAGIPGYTV